jgi:drug/metabolite transporter (DMT)-like permease
MPSSNRKSSVARWRIILAFLTVYLVWGSTYFAIRVAVHSMPPFFMAGARFLLAGGGLLLVARWNGISRPTWEETYQAAIVGILLFVGGNGLVCWSEQTVASGLTALIIAASPLWMVCLGFLFFGQRPPRGWVLVGFLVGILGVIILLKPDPSGTQPGMFWGIVGLVMACGFWAFGSLRSQQVQLPKSSIMSSAVEMLAGGLVLIPLGFAVGEWGQFNPQQITAEAYVSFAYLVILGSMVTLTAYSWLLTVCDAATVSTYAYVNPVVAVVLGTWLGDEPFSVSMAIGACLIILSVILVTLPRWKKSNPVPQPTSTPAPVEVAAEPAAVVPSQSSV